MKFILSICLFLFTFSINAMDILGDLNVSGDVNAAGTLQANTANSSSTYSLPLDRGVDGQILETDGAGTTTWIDNVSIIDTLVSTSTIAGLSANQGKVLDDKITALVLSGGGVTGPISSIDNYVPIFNGTAGNVLKLSFISHDSSSLVTSLVGSSGNTPSLTVKNNDNSKQAVLGYDHLSLGSAGSINAFNLLTPNLSSTYSLTIPSIAPAVNQILQSNASGQLSWINTPVPNTGDVVGPAGSVDNRFSLFSGGTGKLLKTSGVSYNSGVLTVGGNNDLNYGRLELYSGDASEYGHYGPNWMFFRRPNGKSITLSVPGSNPISDVTIKLPSTQAVNNQILQSDATGQLSWINTPAAIVLPTCTGNQRVMSDGSTLSCIDNTYITVPALDINFSSGHVYYKSLAAGATITFSNPVNGKVLLLFVQNTSGANITLTFPAGIKWQGGAINGVVNASSTSIFTITYAGGLYYIANGANYK